jgi:hypothetical protein
VPLCGKRFSEWSGSFYGRTGKICNHDVSAGAALHRKLTQHKAAEHAE